MTIIFHRSALKSLILSLVLAFLSLSSFSQEIPTDEASIAAGKQLFDTNCKTCHRVDSRLIGPPLAGVYDRAEPQGPQPFSPEKPRLAWLFCIFSPVFLCPST